MTKINYNFNHHPFQTLVDDVMNSSISDLFGNAVTTREPFANISETEDAFVIEVLAPGLEKSDFSVTVEEDKLVINVNKAKEDQATNAKIIKQEWSFNKWTRKFNLGNTADLSNVEAKYELGILSVTIAKLRTNTYKNTIEIK
jgi:HSP20 family protein